RCVLHKNSHCKSVPKGTSISFDCLCDPKYFTVDKPAENQKSQPISTGQTFQSCTPIDFCFEHQKAHNASYCADAEASCHSLVEHNRDAKRYFEEKFFVCPDNRALANASRSCKSMCTPAYCSNHGACAQDVYDDSKMVCWCDNGWGGVNCQLQVAPSTT